MAQRVLVWEAHEYEHREKTRDWHWIISILGITASIVAVIFNNVLFAVLLLVGSFTLSLAGSRKPRFMRFEINGTGLLVNKTLYPYSSLDSFYVLDNSHLEYGSKVFIKSRSIATPLIIIPLEDHDPATVRDVLFDHLPEEELHEPFAHHILDMIGF